MGLRGRICTPRGASPLRGLTSIVTAVTENQNGDRQRANASDGTGTMRPWGFDGLALEKLNNPILSVEHIPHSITNDSVIATWCQAFVAAAAVDETVVTCCNHRWAKDGGGAFEVAPTHATTDTVIIWQIEEWVIAANVATGLSINPTDAAPHKTAISHPRRSSGL